MTNLKYNPVAHDHEKFIARASYAVQRWISTSYREDRLYNRSLMLLDGQGVKQDHTAAFLLNAQAAEQGHHDAVLAMGWFYLNGVGVEEDREKAWHWYRKSARQGEPKAMFSLGYLCYIDGDHVQAKTWFSRAIRLGHSRSLYWMARLLWRGLGVAKDQKWAYALIEQASKANVPEAKRVIRFLSRRARQAAHGHNDSSPTTLRP
ncbi:MAG: sel1 repeat family protein [Proteobacteria bacterium]|nr:sel1 repeat family protein [Pseudomonadota bacterium]MCL2307352.1 sel1 repeat family protein [Pseudomonadota bacterium]